MKFRTELFPAINRTPINYSQELMVMGSCFAENIGAKLKYYKFNVCQNPFGILYNPESIAQSLDILINTKLFSKDDLFEHEGVYHSFFHHSRFSSTDKEHMLAQINKEIAHAAIRLKKADHLLITFGTAWVFELFSSGKVVSNCHKVPANKFKRYRLNITAIVERYSQIINKIKTINPNMKIGFTVSPVRHLKDGATQNQMSKATLLLAINQLQENFNFLYYFPAYELVLDDLRDYRFYAEDLTHPSSEAVAYIWEKFKETQIDAAAYPAMHAIEKIKKSTMHRPFQISSSSHQEFVHKQLLKIKQLQQQLPKVDFSEEVKAFENQLT